MKLVALLLTITCVHLFAATSAQIRLKTVKAPLAEVVKEIEQKSQYIFFYDQKLLELSDPVTVDIAAKDIRTVLQMVFSGQSKLGFKIVGKTIVIKESHEKEQNILKNQKEARPATASIRGEVLDENNKPLPGATVRIKGTSLVTTTDRNGDFTLDPGTDANCTLSISFVGYKTKEVDVYSRASSIIVKLEPAETMLDQVQLIGYGTTSKRVSTGNITTVTAKEIQQQPVTNVLTALEGRVPGLFITQNSGQPGTGVNITLRAAASLASGTNPLFIVDGVPYASEPLYTAGGNPNVANLRPAAGSSPLNSINPTDIESISILKDADATAIYGSRGANGVILITTKKGKANETSLNINFSKGISNVPGLDRVKKASLAEYLEVRRQAYANSGTTPSALEAPDLLTWSQTQTSDLPKLLFGRTAPNTDLTASLTGGSGRTTFLLSGVYHDEGQVSPGDYSYRRGGGHLNISHTVPSQKFGIDATVTYNLDQNSGPLQPGALTDLANIAFITPVNYPIYDGTGKLYWVNDPNTSIINPLSYLNRSYKGSTNNLIGNLTIKYHPVKDLNLKVSSSYNRNQLYQQYLYPSTAINPFTGIKPSSSFQENYTTAWNIEPQADYTIYLKDHHINLLAGSTFQSNAYVQPFSIQANNFESDYLLTDYNSAESVRTSSFESKYKYASVFGRANYNYLNKYIFNFNYRWDASSKFGINNRFGSFYSVGGAWVFTEEELLKKNLSWISFGKLRGSYGRTGNDQISNYQFFDTYSPSFATYDNTPTIYPNNVANPDLKWEVNHKLEAALDLNFLKDRISLSASYFINRTNNPLVSFPLANVSGFASYTANMPATVKSYGPEFELSTENIKTTSFRWNSSFNISFPQNKLVRFDAIERTSYVDTYIVGQSLNLLTGFRYSGISPQTNLPVFLDANGDGVNNYAQVGLAAYGRGDYVMIGRTTPDFFGGFNNTFTYKGFQLNVFVQFSGKRMIPGVMSPSFAPGIGGLGSQPYAITAQAYDLFKATGGKIATTDFNFDPATPFGAYYMYQYSNAVLSNAAFARLKTVSMAYNFPAKINQKFHLKNGQLFLRGQNLLTVTKFSGYDPETPASNIPPLRTFVVGLNCSF